ncbi:MAG: M23 family metallopeptidase [Anaerolineae bacterium]|uniref:M23 family metallopeptidase n=1 Tax=Candidatus Amarolinea dominans TaxID=3140696 RepID=UPI00313631C5|nr:M23 family metallopeptidase [Anaerolineae bacterium]
MALLLVAVLVLALSQVRLPQWDLPASTPASTSTQTASADSDMDARGGNNFFGRDTLIRNAVPFTQIPDRPRLDIITYTVQLGDTVYDLSQRFHVSPETLMWANGNLEDNPDLLRLGQKLVVLPVSGVYHKAVKGDTVTSIAKKYKVPASTIVSYAWNKLTDINQPLAVGQMLIVPSGEKPFVARALGFATAPNSARKGTGALMWPASARITQRFWSRHPGIDLAAPLGSPIKAADAGYVVAAGWSPYGYGYHVVIDHGNQMQTLYAHLSKFSVKVGDSVTRGQVIGNVGSTGNSTGPHLHFEVRVRGAQRNPLSMLP